jgi:hypothetical protein
MTLRIVHTMGKVIKQGRLLFAVAIGALGAKNLVCAHVSPLVLANNPPAVPVLRVNLFQDGSPMPKEGTGADVKFDAKGELISAVTDSRIYSLVRSPAFTAHLVALQPEIQGLGLHSFTYGDNCQLADGHSTITQEGIRVWRSQVVHLKSRTRDVGLLERLRD